MAKKKTEKTTEEHAQLAPGIGLDTTLRKGVRGDHKYMECHYIAIGQHPVNGLRGVGPFKSREACKAWINSEQCEYMSLEVADHASDYKWVPLHLDVLTVDGSY